MKYLLAAISTLLIFTSLQCQDDDRGYIVKTGQLAPDFTATTVDGKAFRLSENRGKVVMLQFTASWCGVCRKEMPHIEKEIWLPLQQKDFVLVGLSRNENADVTRKFAADMKVTYPLAPDEESRIFTLYALKEAGVTRNVIIDREGKIIFLTRLFDEKEFNEMKAVIFRELE